MSNEQLPKVFATQPTAFKVEKDKTYAWCTCGLSAKILFAMVDTNNLLLKKMVKQ